MSLENVRGNDIMYKSRIHVISSTEQASSASSPVDIGDHGERLLWTWLGIVWVRTRDKAKAIAMKSLPVTHAAIYSIGAQSFVVSPFAKQYV